MGRMTPQVAFRLRMPRQRQDTTAPSINFLKGIFMHTQTKYLVAAVIAMVSLQGCNQQTDSPAKTQADKAQADKVRAEKVQADVAKAEADGQKKIIDAQAKLDQVVAQNNKDMVGAQTDAQKDATANPNAPAPEASADVAKAHVNAETSVAGAQYDVDKAKAEAAEQVAKTRCEAQAGDANKACISSATASYDSALAVAKAKDDAARAAAR